MDQTKQCANFRQNNVAFDKAASGRTDHKTRNVENTNLLNVAFEDLLSRRAA